RLVGLLLPTLRATPMVMNRYMPLKGRVIGIAAALLAASTTLHAETAIKPKAAEPPLDSSFLDPQPGWTLQQPSAGPNQQKKGVRTITIRPDYAPAPAASGR